MIKAKVNTKSISAKFDKALKSKEVQVEEKLFSIAEYIGSMTRVDTGALAESWSVVPLGSGAGRSKQSRGRPRRQPVGPFQELAVQNMLNDIRAMDIMEQRGVTFRNRAPHVDYVPGFQELLNRVKDRF